MCSPCAAANSAEHPDYDVLNIKATSALTNKDLMNEFNIYIRKGSVREDERASLESPIAFFRSDVRRRSPFAVGVRARSVVRRVRSSERSFSRRKHLGRRCDEVERRLFILEKSRVASLRRSRGDFGTPQTSRRAARARSMRHTLCRDRDE